MIVGNTVAHPWLCDVIGHLTTRHYVAMFDDASYHFLFKVFAWTGATDDNGNTGWVDVRHEIEYKAEVSAGDVLEIHASLVKIGTKSITVSYRMINLGRDELAATLVCTYVLFDMNERQGLVITDPLRQMAKGHLEAEI